VDVGEDGTIYAIKHEIVREKLEGLEYIPVPCVLDYLVELSPEGKERRKPISVIEALRDSPYALLLSTLKGRKYGEIPRFPPPGKVLTVADKRDLFHTNCVNVLSSKQAAKFPLFKAGQVLISIRELDTIALMDMEKRSIVWAARGPWRAQHDARFLENGHLLLFDNRGLGNMSRVLEYDPVTQSFPWSYAGQDRSPFFSKERGMCQRLPNGNTLIVNSEGTDELRGEILEVTANKEVVWTCTCDGYINTARRYSSEELPFLKPGTRARP
jgi:hypothetical protein